jgi:DNA modification methylase
MYVLNSSNIGDIILDPFMWSWTTALACINTNRNYIWFELDEWYYKIANKRIYSITN